MSFNDYYAIFTNTTICKYHDDYKYTELPFTQERGGSTLFKFNHKSYGGVFLSLNMLFERMMPK